MSMSSSVVFVSVLLLVLTALSVTAYRYCDCNTNVVKCNVYGLGTKMYNSLVRLVPKGNLLFSPAGIWWVLYFTYEGAKGATQTALKRTIYSITDSCNYESFMAGIRNKNASYMIFQEERATYWIRQSVMHTEKMLKTFKDKQHIHSTWSSEKDFSKIDGLKVVREYNSNSYKHIGNFLQAGDISKNTVFVVQSLVKLDEEWRFPCSRTERVRHQGRVFTMIEFRGVFGYTYDSTRRVEYIFMEFAYAKLQLVIVVPNRDQKTVDTSGDWQCVHDKPVEWKYLRFSIPKFKFEVEYSLKQVLNDLDCGILFTQDCDTSGINGVKARTSHVIQKTIISIDEEGVKMEAHTILVSDPSGRPRDQRLSGTQVYKPFMFFLYGDDGMLVARGSIMDPTE